MLFSPFLVSKLQENVEFEVLFISNLNLRLDAIITDFYYYYFIFSQRECKIGKFSD